MPTVTYGSARPLVLASAGWVASSSRTSVERAGAHPLRGGDAVAARSHQVDQCLRRQVAGPLDLVTLEVGERRRACPRLGERVDLMADDAAEILDPAQPFVAGVPHQPEPPAGPQHPGHLLGRPFRVEPVPGLRHQNRVDAVVGQRDLLGGAQQRRGVGQRAAQQLEHLGDRVDGDHVEAALDEPGGQLSGACSEVEHVARARRQQPVDRLRRIRRAAALVGGGFRTERQRTLLTGRGHRDANSSVRRIRSPTASVSTRKPSWP